MVTVETFSIVFTGLSISLAAFYYISTLRNAQRSRELSLRAQEQALETRKLQLFLQQYQRVASMELQRIANELLEWGWDDFDDFSEKYGPETNPLKFAEWLEYMLLHDVRGILLKENFVDVHMLYQMDQGGMGPTRHWVKFEPVIGELRRRWNNPLFMKGYEYYVDEMMKMRKGEGLPSKWSPSLGSFVEE